MQILKISQTNSRELWLQTRLGKIMGTKAKEVKPLSRGADRTPVGFWKLFAEKVAIAPDGEPEMDRGHRLENEALQRFADEKGLDIDLDPGIWVSDENDDIAISPDGSEKSDKPTWAAEAKCLATFNHLKHVVNAMRAKTSFEAVPDEFKHQITQYFVVNENLKTLYMAFYDDRVAIEKLAFHVIEVKRKDVEEEIATQKQYELDCLEAVNKLIAEFTEG